jgi:4,5-DOPA dioxygenase extradiol
MNNFLDQNKIKNMIKSEDSTGLMPVLFIGHGTPMNAVEENEFSNAWRKLGETIPRPETILCVSAHWETRGTFVTAMQKPATIHDFGGFPGELYDVQYPAPGSPELAYYIKNAVAATEIGLDEKWGLDHGAWSVIRNIYPKADIPVIQMSIDYHKSPRDHYELAKELASLRTKRVLILGSGNIVHNLGLIAWDHADDPEYGFDWAKRADEIIKKLILDNNYKDLMNYSNLGREVQMAVPTPDHFIPLLYAIALKEDNDQVSFFNEKTVMGSLSMSSVKIG